MTGETMQSEATLTDEAVALVEVNARLLIDQVRAAKLSASQLEAALALVVGVVANDPELQGGLVLQRIAGQVRLCADVPELAAETIGCDIERVNPAILRAAAGVLCDVENVVEVLEAAGDQITVH